MDILGLSIRLNAVNGTSKAFVQIQRDMSKVSTAATLLNQGLKNTSLSFLSLSFASQGLNKLGGTLTKVGEGILSMFTSAGKAIINTGQDMVYAKKKLDLLYSSAKEGDSVMQTIYNTAETSMFNFTDLMNGIVMLKSAGIDGFKKITSASKETNQSITDMAQNLAAFKPEMSNRYGSGVSAAMGAIKEYVAEGNTISLLRGASLDILQILGQSKGATADIRAQQVLTMMEMLHMTKLIDTMSKSPMVTLTNIQDRLTRFKAMIANTQVSMQVWDDKTQSYVRKNMSLYEKYSEVLYRISNLMLKTVGLEIWEKMGTTVANVLGDLIHKLDPLIDFAEKYIPKAVAFLDTHPKLIKWLVTLGAIFSAVTIGVGAFFQLSSSILQAMFALKMLGGLTGILEFVSLGFNAILGPMLLIVGVAGILYEAWKHDIGGLATYTKKFVKELETIAAIVKDVFTGPESVSEETYKLAKENGLLDFMNTLGRFQHAISSFVEGFEEGFNSVFDSLSKTNPLITKLGGAPFETVKKFAEWLNTKADAKGGMVTMMTEMGTKLGAFIPTLMKLSVIVPILMKLKTAFTLLSMSSSGKLFGAAFKQSREADEGMKGTISRFKRMKQLHKAGYSELSIIKGTAERKAAAEQERLDNTVRGQRIIKQRNAHKNYLDNLLSLSKEERKARYKGREDFVNKAIFGKTTPKVLRSPFTGTFEKYDKDLAKYYKLEAKLKSLQKLHTQKKINAQGFLVPSASSMDVALAKVQAFFGKIRYESKGFKLGLKQKFIGEIVSIVARVSGFVNSIRTKFESIKAPIAKVFHDIGGFASKMIPPIAKAAATIKAKMGVAFSNMADKAHVAFDKIHRGMTKLHGGLSKVGGGFKKAALPVAGFAVALGSMFYANSKTDKSMGEFTNGLVNKVTDVADKIPDIIKGMVDFITKISNKIPEMLKTLIPAVVDSLKSLSDSLPDILPPLMTGLLDVITALITEIPTLLPALVTAAVALFKGLVDGLVAIIPILVPMIPTIITSIIGALIQMIPALIRGAIALLMGIIDAIPIALPAIINGIIQLVMALINCLPTLIPALIDAAVQLFCAIVEAIPDVITAFTNAMPQLWEGLKTALWSIAGSLKDLFVSMFSGAFSKVRDWIGWGDDSSKDKPVGENARGTNNWVGGLTLLHEKGGELVDMPRGARIYPHDQSLKESYSDGVKAGMKSFSRLTSNKSSQSIAGSTDNSVTFAQGSVIIQLANASEQELTRAADIIMKKIARKNEINAMTRKKKAV